MTGSKEEGRGRKSGVRRRKLGKRLSGFSIPALLFWLELSLGKLRRFLQITVIAASVFGIAGVCSAFISETRYKFIPYNSLLMIWCLLPLAVVNAVPSLAKRFLVIPSRISAIGTVVLTRCAGQLHGKGHVGGADDAHQRKILTSHISFISQCGYGVDLDRPSCWHVTSDGGH